MSVPSREEIRKAIVDYWQEMRDTLGGDASQYDYVAAEYALLTFERMGYIIKKDVPTNSNDEGKQ